MAEPRAVPFTPDVVRACLCVRCPVQARSRCVGSKAEKLEGVLGVMGMGRGEGESGAGARAAEGEVPKAYCSQGRATCPDLDFNEPCICPGCTIFSRYDLGGKTSALYYCRKGGVE